MGRNPDFVIIGAMKCATSTLHEQLAAQDGIYMSEPKEPNFFSDDEQFHLGTEWYQSFFSAAPDGHLCGESSTHYTKYPDYPDSARRMYDLLPKAKLIYIMRNPVERLVSQYIHEWTKRQINISIDKAVAHYPRLIDYSRYSVQLKPYLDLYGSSRILPVFFERLTNDPDSEFDRVCQFIGYPGDARWQREVNQQNASNNRMRESAVRDALVNNRTLAWMRRRFVPKRAREAVQRLWQMRQRPTLSDATLSHLNSVFDRDLAILGQWLGLDLATASYGRSVRDKQPEWSDAIAGSSPHQPAA